jgi:hypothetical protein
VRNLKKSVLKSWQEDARKSISQGFFPVAWVHKDDVVQAMNAEDNPKFKLVISDEQMVEIAAVMHDNMVDDCYWDLVRQAYEKTKR